MADFAIEIKNLCKHFRTRFAQRRVNALMDLTLQIERGEVFGFLGPNGAGKTTTIKILNNLVFPTSGRALIFDRPTSDTRIRSRLGYLPEHPYFYPHLTGFELLDFCRRIFQIRYADKAKELNELLARVGLAGAEKVLVSKYSKGMVQRLGLAQAIINNPDLVILDEPMEGLDPLGRRDVKNIMFDLKKQGKTVFFSTHILPDVEVVCDRVGILLRGRLVSVGRIDELVRQHVESIELTATRLEEKDVVLIARKAIRVNRVGAEARFVFATGEDADQAVDQIREYGGRLISLVPQSKTLEDYFMSQVSANDESLSNSN